MLATTLTTLVERLEDTGIKAAVASTLPLSDGWMRVSVRYIGQEDRSQFTMVRLTAMTATYFNVLGLVSQEGRVFGRGDNAARHVVVNEAFWRGLFPGQSIVGQQIEFGDSMPWTIVGVVPTVAQEDLNEADKPEAYVRFDALQFLSAERDVHDAPATHTPDAYTTGCRHYAREGIGCPTSRDECGIAPPV